MDLCPSCSAPLTGRTVRQASPEDPLRARRKDIRELRRCGHCGHVAWRHEGGTGPWSDGGSLPEHDYLFATLRPLPEPWATITHKDTRAALEAQLRTEVANGHPLFGKTIIAIARCDACDEVVFSVEEDPVWFAQVHLTWRSAPDRPPWPDSRRLSLPLADSLLDHHH
ncbi:hypothetical protein OG205_23760 [Lentzea sp. NBC_00516]|uniref:hypothetical protein n=1 Tax=Lentzea sp. NBC_00516 TaxID=2903582 RepID=UPI002E80CEFB|nr:hypothetical protein [Lentzea sp. NBC_00516]WUD21164.1 hypothetical protein OG205_23760 [Lentzea sp. NBC_00516]